MPLRETSSNKKGLQPIPSNLVVNLFYYSLFYSMKINRYCSQTLSVNYKSWRLASSNFFPHFLVSRLGLKQLQFVPFFHSSPYVESFYTKTEN